MMARQVGASGQPFPTGVVGSMPRPQFLRDLLDPRAEGNTPPDVYVRRLDAATQYIIAMQEAAGLDLISDGEWRRRSYFGVIAEIMHGFEAYVVDDELGKARPFHTVVEPMTPRRPGHIAEEARFLVRHTDRMTKVCLPSPYLLGQRLWGPGAVAPRLPHTGSVHAGAGTGPEARAGGRGSDRHNRRAVR